MKRDLEVRLVPWNDPRFGALVRALDQEYLDRFGQSALKYRGCHDLKELEQVCLLRAESARGQLEGRYPATLAQQAQRPGEGVDASHVDLRHLGDFEDLEQAGTGKT